MDTQQKNRHWRYSDARERIRLKYGDPQERPPAASRYIHHLEALVSQRPNLKVVLTTGAADKAVTGEDVDNWREVRRYVVNNHKLELKGQLGILDMGNPQVLTDFITWGQDNYPADKYVLVFWDHGGGALYRGWNHAFERDDRR